MMKKLLFLCGVVLLSGCGVIFTGSRQSITFAGEPGTKIYKSGVKIAEIPEGSASVTTKVKKNLSSQTLVAKKEGYKDTSFVMQSNVNGISFINLLNVIAWGIDLGTGAACKYETSYVEIEMEK